MRRFSSPASRTFAFILLLRYNHATAWLVPSPSPRPAKIRFVVDRRSNNRHFLSADWTRLAEEWATINRDDDRPSPSASNSAPVLSAPTQTVAPPPSFPRPAPKHGISKNDHDDEDWQALANQWSSLNSESARDEFVQSFLGDAFHKELQNANGDSTSSPPRFRFLDDSDDLQDLQHLEGDLMRLIDDYKTREQAQQRDLERLLRESHDLQTALGEQLSNLSSEYESYQSQTQQQLTAAQQELARTQTRLTTELHELRQQLDTQMERAQSESQQAYDLLREKQELERQLHAAQTESSQKLQYLKGGYEHELDVKTRELQTVQHELQSLQGAAREAVQNTQQSYEQLRDREWLDYTLALLDKTSELLDMLNVMGQVEHELQDSRRETTTLQHNLRDLESVARSAWDAILKVEVVASMEYEGTAAAPTFSNTLPSMDEVNARVGAIIDNLQSRDRLYHDTKSYIESEMEMAQTDYEARLAQLSQEYEQYKSTTHREHVQQLEQAQRSQQQLQQQVQQLQQDLATQTAIAANEKTRANEFLQRRMDVERELSVTTRQADAKIEELGTQYETEKQGRYQDSMDAAERLQDQFLLGRRWAREAKEKGLEELNKVSSNLSDQVLQQDRELFKKQAELTVTVFFSISFSFWLLRLADLPRRFDPDFFADFIPPPPPTPEQVIQTITPEPLQKVGASFFDSVRKVANRNVDRPMKAEADDDRTTTAKRSFSVVPPEKADVTRSLMERLRSGMISTNGSKGTVADSAKGSSTEAKRNDDDDMDFRSDGAGAQKDIPKSPQLPGADYRLFTDEDKGAARGAPSARVNTDVSSDAPTTTDGKSLPKSDAQASSLPEQAPTSDSSNNKHTNKPQSNAKMGATTSSTTTVAPAPRQTSAAPGEVTTSPPAMTTKSTKDQLEMIYPGEELPWGAYGADWVKSLQQK